MAGKDLLSFLKNLQNESGGVIPFERLMKEALYHQDFGYYSATIRDVGARGDFSTSTTLSDDLGTALSRWIRSKSEEFAWRRVPVIEIGAGNGSLARTTLRHLDWRIRWRLDYMIHETSSPLRELQQRALRWNGIRWISSLPEALRRTKGRALIFSNELVDAFPCRLFEKTPEGWNEMGVKISPEGSLSECSIASLGTDPWLDQFSHSATGQRVERHDSYRSWLQSWSAFWKEGSFLTIDYGETAENLYHRRPNGSLRAYWNHERITGSRLYARFGRQDITADVNFTDLVAWGESLGWNSLPLMSQLEFLNHWLSPTLKGSHACPSAASEGNRAFKVLEQHPLPAKMTPS